ncbi:UDP-glucuronosyl/UDP-glucosyltransferase [Parasponia andersonii]|uniref:Glycosyltransferase n=1 Tax=Parasponia andersonii TaxID=3476 RepID=A0A2P5CSL6_PARAD|nr:UDP-glucuronosyl/UDP-glucosyltransferase [Parasponia andersonii]
MLAWPLGADQFANATLLVDQLKVATTVCGDQSAVPDSAKLARVLVESVGENQVVRQRVAQLCHAALEATKERGGSTKDLESLIGLLAALSLALSVMHSLWRDLPRRQDPNDVVPFPEIPNSPKYPWWQLSPLYRSYVEGDPDSEFVRDGFVANRASWGLAVNSFGEMEGAYLEHLRRDSGHDRVWAVGPVPPLADDLSGPTKRGGSSSISVEHISSWLDKCGDHKVVYVCFGSQAVLHNAQMEELAKGLEKSGVHFVWSVKAPTGVDVEGDYGRVPLGFEDRVAGRGLVIRGWAPQVLILNHRAVGAFLTHCGWNSVLEAVAAGVPMLAWPLGADQFANATLLVDQLKVATTVCGGKSAVPDSAKLARVLAESVGENQVVRQRVAQLCHAALEATKEGGGSTKDLESLIGLLAALTVRNC